MATKLNQLAPGENGVIESVDGDDAIVQRLMEFGLTEGEVVELVATAPLGDPIEVRVRGYQLSLRRNEADHINLRTDASEGAGPIG